MSRTVQFTSVGAAAMIILAAAHGPSRRATGVAPRDMPRLATIDDRYESYNIEMVEVTGGNFWRPYTSQGIATLTAKAKQASASGPTAFSGLPPSVTRCLRRDWKGTLSSSMEPPWG